MYALIGLNLILIDKPLLKPNVMCQETIFIHEISGQYAFMNDFALNETEFRMVP